MENKLTELLNEFSHNLQKLSARPIENMKIILPYENFNQLKYELDSRSPIAYGKVDHKMTVQTIAGIRFEISCKEYEDAHLQKKLQDCFKILGDYSNE